jgi:hypothetical protein
MLDADLGDIEQERCLGILVVIIHHRKLPIPLSFKQSACLTTSSATCSCTIYCRVLKCPVGSSI